MILARCPACSTTFRVRPEQLRARQGRVRCGQCQHAFNALETLVEETPSAQPDSPVPAPSGGPSPALFVLEEKPADAHLPAERIDPYDTWPPAESLAPPVEPPKEPLSPPVRAVTDAEPIIEFGIDSFPDDPPAIAFTANDTAITDAADALLLDEDLAGMSNAPRLPTADNGRQEPAGEIPGEEWPPREPESPDHIPPFAPFPEPAEDAPPPDTSFPTFDDIPAFAAPPPVDAFPPSFGDAPQPPGLPIPDALSLELDVPSDEATATASAADIDFPLPPEASSSDTPIDFETLIHTRDPGHAGEALAQAGDATDAASSTPPLAAAPLPDAEQDEDEPETTDRETPPRSPGLGQAAWAAAATLLTLTVLAQGALVFRNEIALSSPEMRPALESLCAGLGCELPLPRQAADIAIESSDIQPDANREAYFTLHATLRNRAEFQQAWPHVEITLTDARDKALVRRVLEPTRWLPADAPKDAFPGKGEIAIRVAFEAPGVAAAGYRVYAFYP